MHLLSTLSNMFLRLPFLCLAISVLPPPCLPSPILYLLLSLPFLFFLSSSSSLPSLFRFLFIKNDWHRCLWLEAADMVVMVVEASSHGSRRLSLSRPFMGADCGFSALGKVPSPLSFSSLSVFSDLLALLPAYFFSFCCFFPATPFSVVPLPV